MTGRLCDEDMDVLRRYASGNLTRRHAAAILHVSEFTVHNWMRQEGLTATPSVSQYSTVCACGKPKQRRATRCLACYQAYQRAHKASPDDLRRRHAERQKRWVQESRERYLAAKRAYHARRRATA